MAYTIDQMRCDLYHFAGYSTEDLRETTDDEVKALWQEHFNKFRPQGYLTLSNSGDIEIEINDSGDAVRFRMYNGNVSHWQEIKFDKNGEMYFYAYSNRYYLNQFIAIQK
jgi:hypothetical protein